MATELWLLEIHGRMKQDYNQVGLHFELDGAQVGDQLTDGTALINGFVLNAQLNYLAICSDDYEIERFVAGRTKPKLGPLVSSVYQEGAAPGTVDAAVVSNSFCPAVRLIPPLNTQSAGHIFLPAVPTTFVIGNAVQAAYVSAVATFMNGIIAGFVNNGRTCKSAIYSRKTDTYALTSAFNISPSFGFQRRRSRPF